MSTLLTDFYEYLFGDLAPLELMRQAVVILMCVLVGLAVYAFLQRRQRRQYRREKLRAGVVAAVDSDPAGRGAAGAYAPEAAGDAVAGHAAADDFAGGDALRVLCAAPDFHQRCHRRRFPSAVRKNLRDSGLDLRTALHHRVVA